MEQVVDALFLETIKVRLGNSIGPTQEFEQRERVEDVPAYFGGNGLDVL